MVSQQTTIEMDKQPLQKLLFSALEKNDLELFKSALLQNPNLDIIERKLRIFDKACQTPGSYHFIKACLEQGCDVNKYNTEMKMRPINFAAKSMDPNNFKILLIKTEIDVNSQWECLTPLHRIIKNINENNFDQAFACVKVLVEHIGDHIADVNIPDREMITPIVTAAKLNVPRIAELVKYLLDQADIDLDTLRDGTGRKVIAEKFPNLKLPRFIGKKTNFYSLFELILLKNEDKFIADFKAFVQTSFVNQNNETNARKNFFEKEHDGKTMLQFTVKEGYFEIVQALVKSGADINYTKSTSFTPIGLACLYGFHEILEYLQSQPGIQMRNHNNELLLCNVVKKIGDEEYPCSDYTKCFEILLKSIYIDVMKKDFIGNTALYYAVKYKHQYAILKLLQYSPIIGKENIFYNSLVTDINPRILEQYFDSCITTEKKPEDTDYGIIFDYNCLNPKIKSQKVNPIKEMTFAEEMTPIDFISKSTELRCLVNHPLILSFLWLKWHRLGIIFYIKFFLHLLCNLSFMIYCFFCNGYGDVIILWIIIGVVIVRELIEIILLKLKYFTFEKCFAFAIIIVLIIDIISNQETDQTIAGILLLLLGADLAFLVASLPYLSISTHMVMLKTVVINFMKSLILYGIVIGSFALCFYKLIGSEDSKIKPQSNTTDSENNETDDKETDSFNKFLNPVTTLIKTLVMMTGEFDAGDINFGKSYTSYIIFMLFIIFVSIVLLNLLTGLAVSDTQIIRSEAELSGLIYRAQILTLYEKILFKCFHNNQVFNSIYLFPHFIPENQIILKSNQRNIVFASRRKIKSNLFPIFNKLKLMKFNWFSNQCYLQMDRSILKLLPAVFENKKQTEENQKKESKSIKFTRQIEEILKKSYKKTK